MYGQKLFGPSNRYGHKLSNSATKYGHKWVHSKRNTHRVDEPEEEKKSDLEKATREHHSYHNSHNPMHR